MGNEIKVRFALTDFSCEPEEITRKIGLDPSKTWKAGEQILSSALTYEVNGWRLDMVNDNSSGVDDLEDLVRRVLQKLEVSRVVIAELAAKHYAELSCVVFANDFVPALHFSHETLERIARLGAGIDLDLYYLASAEAKLEESAQATV